MPLQKWKLILTNWINCYFNERGFSHITQQKVNVDALLNIILHLRENLGLDESKSSILEAQTLQEFIAEKYPEFTFENGTVDVSTDDELYIAASLLLFFVCVNSKDIDIKNAMCSKLCVEDQQVIMKFSKALMECPLVTIRDVQSAIVEACGQDTVTAVGQCVTVPETPPVLRSLHSEVRRLQAALDAERFDRNFLQEELARTNSKLEKLLEVKEKYKKDVVSLKAKISNCCGQESEGQSLSEATQNTNAKLTRQLEEMEERLVETQTQLDDAVYERNIYKAKVEDLKLERDKWFKFSEEERTLASSLSDQLQSEQQNNEALRELVAELRQHNHHNKLDGSLLECDDPDASMHSLSRNMSVCNEVCANVVEVQLSEERAKIYELKQHIEKLQEQLKLLDENTNIEKRKSNTEIDNLKHQINKEIEKHIYTTETFNDKTSKLNKKIYELEQELKDNNDNAHIALQVKLQEIQILKDENMLLSQRMFEETSMLENKVKKMDYDIKALQGELMDKEQNIEKLQEQLNILEGTTNIEKIKLNTEIENLKQQINEEIEKRIHTTDTFNDKTSKLNNKINELEQELKHNNNSAHIALQIKIQEIQILKDEKMLLSQHLLDETSMFENKVKVMDYDIKALQGELMDKEQNIEKLQEQFNILEGTTNIEKIKLNTEIENLKQQINEEIEKRIHTTDTFNDKTSKLNNKINELEQELKDNNDSAHIALQVKVQEVQILIDEKMLLSQRLLDETSMFENKLKALDYDIKALRGELINKEQYIEKLQEQLKFMEETTNIERTKLFGLLSSKDTEIENLKHQINKEIEKLIDTTETFNDITSKLNNKINELEQEIKDNNDSAHIALQVKVQEIHVLNDEKEFLSQRMSDETNMLKNKIKEMDNDIQTHRSELMNKEQNIESLQDQLKLLKETTNVEKIKSDTEIQNLKHQINKETEKHIHAMETFNDETSKFSNKINKLEQELKENNDSAHTALQLKVQEIQGLKNENKLLSQHMSDETNMLEYKLKEMNNDIQALRGELMNKEQYIEILQEQLKLLEVTTNNEKINLDTEIENLKHQINKEMEKQINTAETFNDEISKLSSKINELEQELKEKSDSAYISLQVKVKEIEILKNEKELLSQHMSNETNMLENKVKGMDNDMQTLRGELLNKEQMIKILEEQLKLLEETANIGKIKLDTEIHNLKLEINKETKKQIYATETFNSETSKLNNKINELERQLKENNDSAHSALQVKVQEIQALKDEKELLSQHMSDETNMLEKKIKDMDNDIQNLKHQITKELEKQIHTTETFNYETSKLNNKINDLEQELKDSNNSAHTALQEKVQEIQALKDEKEFLSQHMSNETNILENKIQEMDYDIQALRDELLSKENNIKMLQEQLNFLGEPTNIEKMKLDTEIQNLKLEINQEMKKQTHTTETFNDETSKLNNKINELEHELKENNYSAHTALQVKEQEIQALKDEKELLSQHKSDETNMLEKKIKDMDNNMQALRDELTNKEENIAILRKKFKLLEENTNISKMKVETEIQNLKHQINKELEKQIHTTETFNYETSKLNNKINDLKQELKESNDSAHTALQEKVQEIQALKDEKELLSQHMSNETNMLENKIQEMDYDIQALRDELPSKEVNMLQEQLKLLRETTNTEKNILDIEIQNLKHQINKEIEKQIHTTESFNNETSKLNIKIDELEQVLKKNNDSAHTALQAKVQEIQALKVEKELLSQHMSDETNMLEKKIKEMDNDVQALKGALMNKEENIAILQEKFKLLEETTTIEKMKLDTEIQNLKHQINKDLEQQKAFNYEISKLNNKINELEQELKENNESTHTALQVKVQEIQALKDEKEFLSQHMSDETNMLEKKIKEMENDMQALRVELMNKEEQLKLLEEITNTEKIMLDTEIQNLKHQVNKEIEKQIHTTETFNNGTSKLSNKIHELEQELNEKSDSAYLALQEKVKEIQVLKDEKELLSQHMLEERNMLESKVKEMDYEIMHALRSELIDKKQNIKMLTEQLKLLEETTNIEKMQLVNLVSSKDTEIVNLKHEINKEIEKLIHATETFNDETSKFSNKINELEQELKDNNSALQVKEQEIQVLQDEKVLLAQRMSDETNVLENKIKEMDNYTQALKGEMNKEQNTKLQMKENYENQYMNLRERIWNRNNELVELQNNMETTDRHLRKCSEKQLMLQKERDRLTKVSKLNETEIINIKKYLADLSVYFKTFSSAKEVYNKKLVQVVSLQRRVRKEILELEGHTSASAMCCLERGHAAILQDLAECAMNLERWVERYIRRAISPEKIMQAFTSDYAPLSTGNLQNTSLEVQLEVLENNLQKLLEELARVRKDDAAKAQAETVMEVRAEYEDKLNRMKTKMKLLYQDQITKFHEKQKEEIAWYEKQLQTTKEKMADSSRAYENHIKGLTTELWNVGEKLLIKNEEADWLRRKQVSGSLMSLQHLHSSGLVPAPDDRSHRPSDTHSLRSLPVQNKKPEGRALHMSDEEGEVFDNRFLAELTATPRAPSRARHRPSSPSAPAPGPRLSELRWRNSLCPPHLKSSYPAETQFAPTLDEDDIKCVGGTASRAGARKEVGITAYKKPGPPTPSKQAGRLSATDSELRESLRPEPELPRKTSTPARIARMLFRYSRSDTDNASTPHKRMSIFRSKK